MEQAGKDGRNKTDEVSFLWCYDNAENNWCGDIRKIAETLHKQQIYNTKRIFNIGKIQKQCIELMSIEWKNEILMKPKLRTYI